MGKDYLHYTTDDFIADEYFQRWVRFPDKETDAFWKNWISKHPEQRDHIMKASAFINHLNFRSDTPDEQKVEASLNRSLQMIREKESSWRFRMRNKNVLKKFLWVTALSVTVFLAFTLWQSVDNMPLIVEVVTRGNQIKRIVLPDSSVVTLNANSSFKYPSHLNEKPLREVWLTGEAFFDVQAMQRNKKARRFIVHSDQLKVDVLGTSFNVRKREDVYNVSVNSGNIKIRLEDGEASTIYLKPGDFFQYSTKEKSLLKKRVNPELYCGWKNEKMVLDKAPLSQLAALIHDTYGYNTIIANKELEDDKISGSILMKDEQTFFQALSFALNIDIIKKDKDLIFQSKNKTR